jgi:hypothetical protein
MICSSSETAMLLSLRLRRFRVRRRSRSGAFEAMRCSVQSGRGIQRISETVNVPEGTVEIDSDTKHLWKPFRLATAMKEYAGASSTPPASGQRLGGR